jgi:DnaJ-class molecular chaperone
MKGPICVTCDGTGFQKCIVCHGTGTCHRCRGSGKEPNPDFVRRYGWTICGACEGSGKCRNCHGEGGWDCSACHGKGYRYDVL